MHVMFRGMKFIAHPCKSYDVHFVKTQSVTILSFLSRVTMCNAARRNPSYILSRDTMCSAGRRNPLYILSGDTMCSEARRNTYHASYLELRAPYSIITRGLPIIFPAPDPLLIQGVDTSWRDYCEDGPPLLPRDRWRQPPLECWQTPENFL